MAPPPRPSPKGRGLITEIPHRYEDKAKTKRHRDTPTGPATYAALNMSLKNMFLCHSGLILSMPLYHSV